MEKKREAAIVYSGHIGIMEKKVEATIRGLYKGYDGDIVGVYIYIYIFF